MTVDVVPIPRIDADLTASQGSVPALKISEMWFRFLERLARSVEPVHSTTIGNQTLNARIGSFVAAAGSVATVITNNQVNTNSVLLCQFGSVVAASEYITSALISTTKVGVTARGFQVTYSAALTFNTKVFFHIVAP